MRARDIAPHSTAPSFYCSKQCHTKQFGTRDLRQANLPHRDDLIFPSRSQSPQRSSPLNGRSPPPSPTRISAARPTSPLAIARNATGQSMLEAAARGQSRSPPPLRTNRALSPTFASFRAADQNSNISSFAAAIPEETGGDANGEPEYTYEPQKKESDPPKLGLTRTFPLTTALTNRGRVDADVPTFTPSLNPTYTGGTSPIRSSATGTRYGAALGGTSSPLHSIIPTATGGGWGGRGMPGTSTPLCARCGKAVYFAEQVKASGKTFHKPCLRCTVCNTALDSGKLTEKDGQVMCQSCYGKVRNNS